MASQKLRDWLGEGPFTLALSSSFFGFYAHCGVVAALFEHGFIPNKITGASAGALVGGALSSGLSPQKTSELLFKIRKEDFWDPAIGFGLLRGRKFLKIVEENFVPTFAKAEIPLEVTVFDLLSLKTSSLHSGSLPKAVVASCAVPVMFHPVRIEKRFYIDGGVFHKSGMHLSNPGERVLCIYLLNRGLADSYEMGGNFRALGENQRVLRLTNLPRVNYNHLENGKTAYKEGYRRCSDALKLALHGSVLDN